MPSKSAMRLTAILASKEDNGISVLRTGDFAATAIAERCGAGRSLPKLFVKLFDGPRIFTYHALVIMDSFRIVNPTQRVLRRLS